MSSDISRNTRRISCFVSPSSSSRLKIYIHPIHLVMTFARSRSHIWFSTHGTACSRNGLTRTARGDHGTRLLHKNPFQAGSAAGWSNANIGTRRCSPHSGSTYINQFSLLKVIETAWSEPSPGEANKRSIRVLMWSGISEFCSCFSPGTAWNKASAHIPKGPLMACWYVRRDWGMNSPPRLTFPIPLSVPPRQRRPQHDQTRPKQVRHRTRLAL